MKRISQRELRNNSGEIMRGLQRGESYELTNRGNLVGRLVPAERSALDELTLRRASRDMYFPKRVKVADRSEDILRELRGDR